MKTKLTLLAGIATMVAAALTMAHGQTNADPGIKVLPTAQKGILKVLYAHETNQAVQVKFFNEDGVNTSDKIKGEFRNGFSKKYDVRNIQSKSFWVEISDRDMSVTYKLIESADGKTFIPYLEKTTYNHLVAANTSLGLN